MYVVVIATRDAGTGRSTEYALVDMGCDSRKLAILT